MKKLIIIIVAVILAGFCLGVGYQAGKMQGKANCIATVTENCREICGVGDDFCYPDDEETAIESEGDENLAFYGGGRG